MAEAHDWHEEALRAVDKAVRSTDPVHRQLFLAEAVRLHQMAIASRRDDAEPASIREPKARRSPSRLSRFRPSAR